MTCIEIQAQLWPAESEVARLFVTAIEVDWDVTLTKVCLATTNFGVFFTLS
jgi:hypothetical protein